ncbi:hypothetical protein [Streptomyces spiramenti]|uniref:Lon proteolytic domain-containing protein n=1 Tax=Streptomyces spiramenti TaxID=2720606 RepID=A0ABX1AV34_9ACTN|nr:hypothetical protein [Streptomyces spiramenti]NJP68165.1 hypothetical protein [Streptomyces spiramenti]
MSPSLPASRNRVVLIACAAAVTLLLAVAALAPLPFSVAHPGATVDVLGEDGGEPVISVEGAGTRTPEGELRMTTIMATGPDAAVRLPEVVRGYLSDQRAVLPRSSVYPVGDTSEEIREHNSAQMTASQGAAVDAALALLEIDPATVEIGLRLEDVGGPSAGLLFSLGIIDLLRGDGEGGDLTGGLVVAGTGTIAPDGTVGSVGGVPLKTHAARRDGADVFLVPAAECADAAGNRPEGLRLIPVATLDDALSGLRALNDGGTVPSC